MLSAAGSGELLFTPRIAAFFNIAALPIAIHLFFGKPVDLLQVAGAIAAAHVPIVTGLTLYLNHRILPKELRPSTFTFRATVIAGLFFEVFALIYLYQLIAQPRGG